MKNNPNYQIKNDKTYYARDRFWPSLFNIRHGAKILDIGCGSGVLGLYLKERYRAKVAGVEILEENFKNAVKVLDSVSLGDIELMDLAIFSERFDYIIFSDSLEHMLNPENVLGKIKSLINNDGFLMISIPNVRNFRVTIPLILRDQWEYGDEGLLDKTHLRFFTGTSIYRLLEDCGFSVLVTHLELPLSSKAGLLNFLTFGLFRRHLTSHYYIKACLKK